LCGKDVTVGWGSQYPGKGSKKSLPDYRGWQVWDEGENYHPAGARFGAIRMGVIFGGYTLEQLKKTIDSRTQQYPGSGGA